MQVDLQTIALKPLRNTFKHIEKRFGDKVASRYQEATYDLQPTDNFHYRPTWDLTTEEPVSANYYPINSALVM